VVEIPKGDCVKSYSSCVSGRDSVGNLHLGYNPERSSLSRNASSYVQLNQRFERSMTASISTSFLPDTAKFHFIERGFPGSGTAVRMLYDTLFGMDEWVLLE
jgi:hypothetical protein